MNHHTPMLEAFTQWTTERVADKLMATTTQSTYLRHAKAFVKSTGNKAVGNITFDDVRTWANSMSHLSASSVSSRHGAIKSFFGYCVKQGHIDVDPTGRIEAPKVKPGEPRPTPKRALEKALAGCVAADDRRGHLMLRFGSELGLRRFEIAKAHRDDFDFEAMRLSVVGKGGKRATLPLSKSLAAEVQQWIDAEGVTSWLFAGRDGGPLSPMRCGEAISKTASRVGETFTAHTLRHRAATDVLHTAGGIKAAQRLMRHHSVATTDVYARFDVEDLRAYVEEIVPKADT